MDTGTQGTRKCHHIIEVLGEYTSDTGVTVENVTEVVNINTEGTQWFITHKFSTGWVVCVVKGVEKKKSVSDQFAFKYKSETHCCTEKLNKEDYGVDKYFFLM